MYTQYVMYSPVGEYLRLVILQRLARGPASVEEINDVAVRRISN
ncbi:MAG: hypothetical protein ACPL3C_13305 [Pyrobaculum sp.]